MFMGTRVIGRVYAITDKDGKREVKVLLQGLTQPNGLAFKDGSLYVFAINQVFRYDNIEDKLDNPRRAGRADRERTICRHHPPQLEIRGVRAGRQDVRAGRLELQHLRDQSRHPRPDPPLQRGRHRHGDRGARRAQHGRLRLASGDQGTVVHRQRPRLGRQRRTGRRAQPHSEGQEGASFGFPYCHANGIPDPDIKRPEPVRRRDHAGRAAPDRTPPASASSSTPATCSRRSTRTSPSSRGTARGTASRSSATTW